MRRWFAVFWALALVGCSQPVQAPVFVAPEPITVEPTSEVVERAPECPDGPDDGLGGTGCQPLLE